MPDPTLEILSLSTQETARRLKERELHLAIAYTEHGFQHGFEMLSLYRETFVLLSGEGFINDALLSKFKRGAYLVNTACSGLCDRQAVVWALESGQPAGYSGDVWYPQPAPVDHPWRRMPNHAMTPHISGTSLSAQARYAAGTLEILQDFLAGKSLRQEYLIVDAGSLAGAGANAYQL